MKPEWSLLTSQKPFTEFKSDLDTGSLRVYYQILVIQYSFTCINMFYVWIFMTIL
jgi:hypothetical protein